VGVSVTIQKEGRRHYLVGLPFGSYRDQGANWDPERKLWWTGKLEVAEALATQSTAKAAPKTEERTTGANTVVAGRATYKDREYFVVGKIERGDTRYDDRVNAVMACDGERVLLSITDGSSQFWADCSQVQAVKVYNRPQTIGRLAKFAAKRRASNRLQDFEEEIERRNDRDDFVGALQLTRMGYDAWCTARERT
jgi:hypothetical protein